MTLTPWTPIVEQLPPERQVVIVAQTEDDGYHIYAGWLRTSHDGARRWWAYTPDILLSMMGEVRATDFWLSLPQESPVGGCVRGGYPA